MTVRQPETMKGETNMPVGIGAIHVKKERGRMVVIGKGMTPKGKAYIKERKPLLSKSPQESRFKDELEKAVAEILLYQPSLM